MQARARIVAVSCQAQHAHADDRRQTADQHQIGQQDEQDRPAGRRARIAARRRARGDGHQPDGGGRDQEGDGVGRHEQRPGATAGQPPPERTLGVVTFDLRGGEVRHHLAASTSCGRFSTPELLN
ncbi:hypothetical protein D3C87_1358370 [compost metagenome]